LLIIFTDRTMEVKLSAVIITFNEERNIGSCLTSLEGIVDEIVIVDSYSTDRTREICESHGAVFIPHVFRDQLEQKNWAIDQATYPHIISLNADESLSPVLRNSISAVKKNWKHDSYYFNRLSYYCGKWIRHSSWYPNPQLRLWDSRKGSWAGCTAHGKFSLDREATKEFIEGDLLHNSFDTIQEHFSQVMVNSTIEARSCFLQGKKSSLAAITVQPFLRFLRNYFLRSGFRDGYFGLVISVNSAFGEYMKYVKLLNHHKEFRDSKKQTICFFNSTPAWGGGEKWHFEFSNSFYRNGHPVLIFTNHEGELRRRVLETGIPSYGISVANLSFLNPVKIFKLARILKKEGVGLIVMNLSIDMKFAGPAAKLAGVKRIIYRRGSAIPIRNNFVNRILLRKVVSEIIANSHETKRTILRNNPNLIDLSKIKVIYNGMDFGQFESDIKNPCYKAEQGEVILGNAGRLVKQKAQKYLVDLAVELKKRKVKFKILIAGDGRLEEQLKEYARVSGVEDVIVFLGFVEDMKSFTDSIDIFVLTSLWEGFGYVLVEAMANAKPIVAFDISSNPEVVDDGKNGFLIPPFDMELFADRAMQLMTDMKLRKQFGRNARESAYARFNYERAFAEVEEFLLKK